MAKKISITVILAALFFFGFFIEPAKCEIEENVRVFLSSLEDAIYKMDTYMILKNLKYDFGKKVADVTWKDFEINQVLEESLFEL